MKVALLAVVIVGIAAGLAIPTARPVAVAPASAAPADTSVATVIDRAASGHFLTVADVNEEPIRFVVDTGADIVALTQEDARRAHVDFDPLAFEVFTAPDARCEVSPDEFESAETVDFIVPALSLTVFAFFLVFGMLAIEPDVIESWVGHPPRYLPSVEQWVPVSRELFQVSVFLAGFAGLYFTVYAVTVSTYRDQFFSSLSRELEQAIGVYTVYETLRHEDEDETEVAAKT